MTVESPILGMFCQVRRDGNRHRRHAIASTIGGKIGPLDLGLLRKVMAQFVPALPHQTDSTLVVGLAESSLIMAWLFMTYLSAEANLVFTTRDPQRHPHARLFREPHSHGPVHFLQVSDRKYARVIIIEDEITTGRTLTNLVLELRDLTTSFIVLTIVDLRTEAQKSLQREMYQGQGIDVTVETIYSSHADPLRPIPLSSVPVMRKEPRWLNPHHRANKQVSIVLEQLHSFWHTHGPCPIYMIGECIDLPLAFCDHLRHEPHPLIRHITLSPWQVDGQAIYSRLSFQNNASQSAYYLYNWEKPSTPHALVIGDIGTRAVAREIQAFLNSKQINAIIVEVP